MGQNISHQKSDSSNRRLRPGSASIKNENLCLEGYTLMHQLGEGSYGRVRMVRQKATNKYLALKYIDKRHIPVVLKTIVEERNVLGKLRHPFICNLKYAFQDNGFYFLVLDLGEAGDLRHHIGKFSFLEATVRHWIAELACAVEYLHENNIVHRDIKPENILLDSAGHVKLADFNVARELTYNRPVINGVSGTFNYLAPEMHQGVSYTEQVDWWALGIVFYECIYNQVPFRVKSRSKILSVMTSPGLVFPPTTPPVSESCRNAIRMFLHLYPPDRVSSTKQLFQCQFFRTLERKILETAPSWMKTTSNNSLNLDSLPVYKPTSTQIFKNIHTDDIVLRENLESEYAIWQEKKLKEELEKKKKQRPAAQEGKKVVLAALSQQDLFQKSKDNEKQVAFSNAKVQNGKVHGERVTQSKGQKLAESRESDYCLFSMSKFIKLVSRGGDSKQYQGNKPSVKTSRENKKKERKSIVTSQVNITEGNVKQMATIKFKCELQQSFAPFDCQEVKSSCPSDDGLTETTTSGTLTAVTTTTSGGESSVCKYKLGKGTRNARPKSSNTDDLKKLNESTTVAYGSREGSSTGGSSSGHHNSSDNQNLNSQTTYENEKLLEQKKAIAGENHVNLPNGVLAMGQHGRMCV